MPQPTSDLNATVIDVRHLFDTLVHTVGSGVQSGVEYASVLGNTIYNFYSSTRYGQTTVFRSGWRDGYAPEEIEEAIPSAGRTLSEPLPYTHLATPHSSVQGQVNRELELRLLKKGEAIVRRQQKLVDAQDRASLRRAQAIQRRENLLASLNFLSQSADTLVDALAAASSQSTASSVLSGLCAQLTEDKASLQANIALMHHDDTSLFALDHSVRVRSSRLSETVASLISAAGLQRGCAPAASPASTRSNSPKPSSPVPSLISRYLDRRGDAQMLRERLHNFNLDYLDEVQRREIRRERNEELDVPEEDFEKQYREEREALEHDLALAEQEVTDLELAGERQGLDTSFATRRFSESEDESLGGEPFTLVYKDPSDVNSWIERVSTSLPQEQRVTTRDGCSPPQSL